MDTNIILGITNCLVGVLMVLLFIPLKKGVIKMNMVYGIRFEKSFKSDDNCKKINEYGAERFMKWSLTLFLIGVVSFFIPLKNNIILIFIFTSAPLFVILPPTIETYLYAKKYKREIKLNIPTIGYTEPIILIM